MQSLELRKVNRESLGHWRELGIGRFPLEVNCLAIDWSLSLRPIYKSEGERVQLKADWGGAKIVIRLHESWLGWLGSQMLQLDFSNSLPENLRLLVYEAAFAEVADLLEESTRKRFNFIGVDQSALLNEDLHGFELAITDDRYSTDAELWVDDKGLGFLANAARSINKSSSDISIWSDIPVPIQFVVGWTDLPVTNFKNIEKYDVILFDECLIYNENNFYIKIGRRNAIEAHIEGKKISVLSSLEKIMLEDEMQISENQIDEIDIRLTFDLGERTLSLAELRLLSPGYIFDLGRDLRKSVFIRANGKIIGEGELVDIDGQTGVSVLSFSSHKL